MKRTVIKMVVSWLVIFLLMGGFWLQQGGWMDISPTYHERNLLGLSSSQVIQKLGKPWHDPRMPFRAGEKPEWSSEATDGPLHLGYIQGWNTCVIELQNDRVVSVKRFWK